MGLEELLDDYFGDVERAGRQRQAERHEQENPLLEILGGVLGGGASSPSGRREPSYPPSRPAPAPPRRSEPQPKKKSGGFLEDLFENVFGGGQPKQPETKPAPAPSSESTHAVAGRMLEMLEHKLRLPERTAQQVVQFVFARLSRPGPGLDSLLRKMNRGEEIDAEDLDESQLVEPLMRETGLEWQQAALALRECLWMIIANTGARRGTTRRSNDLKHLLETWH